MQAYSPFSMLLWNKMQSMWANAARLCLFLILLLSHLISLKTLAESDPPIWSPSAGRSCLKALHWIHSHAWEECKQPCLHHCCGLVCSDTCLQMDNRLIPYFILLDAVYCGRRAHFNVLPGEWGWGPVFHMSGGFKDSQLSVASVCREAPH